MKKKTLILGIIILLLIGIAYTFFYLWEITPKDLLNSSKGNLNQINDSQINQRSTINSSQSSGGSSSTSTKNLNSPKSNSVDLPADLYTNECGFYADEYGVCAGYCPRGTCVQEDRSCYCKID